MNTVLAIILIIIGIIALAFTSEWAIRYLKKVAKAFNVHDIIIGLTITSIGTSLPEIFTNVNAAIQINAGVVEAGNIAIGNVIGSCLSQITIVIGIVALFGTLKPKRRTILRDGSIMVLATVLMYFFSLTGRVVSPLEGLIMVILYTSYIIWVVKSEDHAIVKKRKQKPWKDIILNTIISLFFIGLVVFSARIVLDNALFVATNMGVSSLVIGLLIGLGTSLPELAIAISAIKSKSIGISVGDLIGSNITDPLLSLGIGAMVAHQGFMVDASALFFDFPIWIISSIFVLMLFHQYKVLTKPFGIFLILFYIGFLFVRFFAF